MNHQSLSLQIDTIVRYGMEISIQTGVVKALNPRKEALLFLKEEEKKIIRTTHTATKK